MDQQQLNRRCLKHTNQFVSLLKINSETKEYDLVCQRCISVVQGMSHIFNISDILSQQDDILYNWPLALQENAFDEMLQLLDYFSSQEIQIKISEKIKKMRSTFDSEITKLENMLVDIQSNKIQEQFYKKYKEFAQINQLISYVKEELNQNGEKDKFSENFKEFIKNQVTSNYVENLINYLKVNKEKQDNQLQTFDEIIVQLQKIFQDSSKQTQFELKKKQQDLEQRQLQTKIQDLNSQFEQLQKKYEEEQNIQNEKTQTIMQLTDEISTFKKQQSQLQNQNKDLQNQLNQYIDYCSKYNQKKHGNFSHLLKLTISTQRNNDNLMCYVCYQKNQQFLWDCQSCEYKICQDCMEKNQNNKFEKYEEFFLNLSSKKFVYHQHKLQITNPSQRNYSCSTYCDNCSQDNLYFSWNCSSCSYDVCSQCMQNEEKDQEEQYESYFLNLKSQKFPEHGDELKLTTPTQRTGGRHHTCDICSEGNSFFMWRCEDCDFDLCLVCASNRNSNQTSQLSNF